jgi:hypothetical protein
MENLARYIIRASFSQEGMTYSCESPGSSADPKTIGKKKLLMP